VAFVVTTTASVLTAPFLHPHYLVMLLLPAALLADRGRYWGLVLPLLGWLPSELLPLVVLGTVVILLLPMPERAGERRPTAPMSVTAATAG
jgi:hypothetical protein